MVKMPPKSDWESKPNQRSTPGEVRRARKSASAVGVELPDTVTVTDELTGAADPVMVNV